MDQSGYLEAAEQRFTEFGGFAPVERGALPTLAAEWAERVVERVEPGLTTLVAFLPLRTGSLLSAVRDELVSFLTAVAEAGRTEALGVMVIVSEEPITQEIYDRLQELTQSGGRVRVVPWVADLHRNRLFAHDGPPFGIDPDLFMLASPAAEQAVEVPRAPAGRQRANTPWLTVLLAGIIVAIWTAMTVLGGSLDATEQAELLIGWGAVVRPDMVMEGEYWRLFTAGFLHIGIEHLFVNALSLWWLGRLVEALYGRVRMLLLYVVSLVAGSVASLMFGDPYLLGAGASGAIFGLMGAILWYRLVGPHRQTLKQLPILTIVVINLAYGLFYYQTVDNFAHLGGLAGGFLTAAAVGVPGQWGPKVGRLLLHGLATLVLLSFSVAATLGFLTIPGPAQRLIDAIDAYNEGRFDAAEKGLAEASERHPEIPDLHVGLTRVYYEQGRLEEARRHAAKVLDLDPRMENQLPPDLRPDSP